MRNVLINDTTLHNREQSAGIDFTVAEKVALATLIDAIGIPELEIVIPAMGKTEAEAITEINHYGINVTKEQRALFASALGLIYFGLGAQSFATGKTRFNSKRITQFSVN